MVCYHPLDGFLKKGGGWTANPALSLGRVPMRICCGQCIGCRLEKSRQWAVRIQHEAQLHGDRNCFITLTYDDEAIEERGHRSLDHRDWQLFMKKLRKKHGSGIKFLMCGEYGTACRFTLLHPKQCEKEGHHDGACIEGPGRPHFHACLFNHDFGDKRLWTIKNGFPLFVSPQLEELWPQGFSSLGAVTFQSGAYVARYIMKKRTGPMASQRYSVTDPQTGELQSLLPEYLQPSRGGRTGKGIAHAWFERYSADVYPHDFVVANQTKCRPPRAYDKYLEVADPDLHSRLKRERKQATFLHAEEQTPQRLSVRETVQQRRLDKLERKL